MSSYDVAESTEADGRILPAKIPNDDLLPDQVRGAADTLVAAANRIRTNARDITTGWGALPAVYEAPTAAVVYAAMTPITTSTTEFIFKITLVARALNEYAANIATLKAKLEDLRADAEAFRREIDGGVWVLPQETTKYEGYTNGRRMPGEPDPLAGETQRIGRDGFTRILADWKQSSEHVDRNNVLLDRVADQYSRLSEYEAECANAINAQRDTHVADVVAVEAWQLKQDGDGTADLPWGHRVDEDRNCGESVWHGVGTGGLDTIEGLGSLISFNPQTQGWGDWGNAGAAWTGVGVGLGSLALSLSPVNQIYALFPGPFQDLMKGANENSLAAAKGMVAWDEWGKDPGEALGVTIFNVATIFIPGPKGLGPILKLTVTGTKIFEAITIADRIVDKIITKIPGFEPFVLAVKVGDDGFDLPQAHGGADLPHGAGGVDIPHGAGGIDLPPRSGIDEVLAHPHGEAPATPDVAHPGTEAAPDPAPHGTLPHDPPAVEPHAPHEPDAPTEHSDGPGADGDAPSDGHDGTDGGDTPDGGGHADPDSGTGPDHGNDPGSPAAGEPTSPTATPDAPSDFPRPTPDHQIDIAIGDKDSPGARTPFASRADLAPDTVYHVEGRGDFYTDSTGKVSYVETAYGGTGHLNPDLMKPQPDTTYVVHPDVKNPLDGVNHDHVFQTDNESRTILEHTDALSIGDADRSGSIQTSVGDQGGVGYDGGHGFGTRFGGGGEHVNITAQLRDINRGAGDSFFNLENKWADLLKNDPNTKIEVDVQPQYEPGNPVPRAYEVSFSINGAESIERIFKNG